MKLNNTYYMLRHGEAVSNIRNVMSCLPETFENPLTERGVSMIHDAVEILKSTCDEQARSINIIFASDILRAKQTAQIVANALNSTVNFEPRLREINFGKMNGKPAEEVEKDFGRYGFAGYGKFGGEDYSAVAERVYAFLQELEQKYQDKVILLVSHQSPLYLLEEKVKGFLPLTIKKKFPEYLQMRKGEVRELTVI